MKFEFKDFTFKEAIGQGNYGTVYRAELAAISLLLTSSSSSSSSSPSSLSKRKQHRQQQQQQQQQQQFAIKVVHYDDNDTSNISKEIELLKALNSPFIVSYYGYFYNDNNLYMIMELCDGGSLEDYININGQPLLEKEIKGIVAFTLLGLNHLHNNETGLSYIHRDIKSANILLLKNGRSKLADLGITAELTNSHRTRNTVIGSPYWMAPELIQEVGYDVPVDIWSLGIVILECCNGKVPRGNINPMRAIFKIVSDPAPGLSKPGQWSDECRDFLRMCLVKDPKNRATAKELLEHPWLVEEIEHITFLLGPDDGLPSIQALVAREYEDVSAYRETLRNSSDNIAVLDKAISIKSNLQNEDDDLFLKLSNSNNKTLKEFTWQNMETIRTSFKQHPHNPMLSTNSDILHDNDNNNNSIKFGYDKDDNNDKNDTSLLKTRIKVDDNEISPIKDNNITSALKYFQNNTLEEELQELEKSYQEELKVLQLSYSRKKIELLNKYKN